MYYTDSKASLGLSIRSKGKPVYCHSYTVLKAKASEDNLQGLKGKNQNPTSFHSVEWRLTSFGLMTPRFARLDCACACDFFGVSLKGPNNKCYQQQQASLPSHTRGSGIHPKPIFFIYIIRSLRSLTTSLEGY